MTRFLIFAGLLGGLAVLVRFAPRFLFALMEHMLEHHMPGMMNRCFSMMDRQRREFMLAHCRGMLDQMEAKYLQPEDEMSPFPPPSDAQPAG